MNPPITASANQVYNDGGVQYGSFFATVKRGATRAGAATVGQYYFESFHVNRPLKKVTQPDEIGGPNGFVLVNDYNTASYTLQVGPVSNNRVLNGDWIEVTLDSQIGLERFVLQVDSPYEVNSYYKQSGTGHKASFPT